jgi:hypothetical protein
MTLLRVLSLLAMLGQLTSCQRDSGWATISVLPGGLTYQEWREEGVRGVLSDHLEHGKKFVIPPDVQWCHASGTLVFGKKIGSSLGGGAAGQGWDREGFFVIETTKIDFRKIGDDAAVGSAVSWFHEEKAMVEHVENLVKGVGP